MAKSIQDLIDLDINDVMRMNRKELSKVVSQLSSAANKRLKRLGASEIGALSPAFRGVTESGRDKFSVKKKTTNQLRNEYKAVRSFLRKESSSVKGWEKQRKRTYERIGGDFGNLADEQTFWRIYRRLDQSGEIPAYGSTESQVALRRIMTERPHESDSMYEDLFRQQLTDIYEDIETRFEEDEEYDFEEDPFFTLFDDLPD